MGNRDSERFQIPFTSQPRTGQAQLHSYSYVISRAKLTNTRGSAYTVREEGCYSGIQPSTSREFLLRTLPGPQRGGHLSPVINLKNLNEWVTFQRFKMESMGTLRKLLKKNDWMVKVYLKYAYYTVHPIHPSHHSYLRFMVGQQHYQFTCLSSGLSCAPWVFTKVMKPIVIFLCSMGVRMIVYIDNILLMGGSDQDSDRSDILESYILSYSKWSIRSRVYRKWICLHHTYSLSFCTSSAGDRIHWQRKQMPSTSNEDSWRVMQTLHGA